MPRKKPLPESERPVITVGEVRRMVGRFGVERVGRVFRRARRVRILGVAVPMGRRERVRYWKAHDGVMLLIDGGYHPTVVPNAGAQATQPARHQIAKGT